MKRRTLRRGGCLWFAAGSMVIFGLVLPAALFRGRDPDAVFIRDGLFLWLLIALSESDIRCRTLPDALILQGIVLWLLWLVSEGLSGNGECLRHLASKGLAAVLFAGAALMLSLLADRFFRKETLGGGDVKMLFMVVLYLGFYKGFLCLIIAAFSGFIFLAVRKEKEIPWGPFLAAGAFFALLFGEPVLKFLKLL